MVEDILTNIKQHKSSSIIYCWFTMDIFFVQTANLLETNCD